MSFLNAALSSIFSQRIFRTKCIRRYVKYIKYIVLCIASIACIFAPLAWGQGSQEQYISCINTAEFYRAIALSRDNGIKAADMDAAITNFVIQQGQPLSWLDNYRRIIKYIYSSELDKEYIFVNTYMLCMENNNKAQTNAKTK